MEEGSSSHALLRREGTCHREQDCDANGPRCSFSVTGKDYAEQALKCVSYVSVILVDISPVSRKTMGRCVK